MATNVKIQGEVVSAEKKTGYIKDYLEVTVRGDSISPGFPGERTMTLTFRAPLNRAKSYPIGRVVTIGVAAK